MPKLYSSREILKVLEKRGFILVSQKGSHIKYRKDGKPTRNVIIPANKKEIPMGTFRSILRQAAITQKEFEEMI